ncbi:alkaline phosphatase family protein [Leifsonia sp. NPDC058248]|uniref:alkaline phosphatase family protein n=1 Tax=Leifsonia sp. NPDC058248 TaxID=3346402 RepID=UPI0036D84105
MRPHRRATAAAVIMLGMLLAGCASGGGGVPSGSGGAPSRPTTGQATGPTASAAASSGASGAVQHVVVIVDENKPATSIIGNTQAPYLNGLASQYARASRYSAITHPSLPNYLALTSGTTGGIRSDCAPGGSCLVTGPNLADSLVKAGLSWRMYAESMPKPCDPCDPGEYAVKHNPFLYYPSVTHDAVSCAQHVVPFTQFATDLSSAPGLPAFSFISPNLCNDMHDCSVATGDAWLAREVPAILASPSFTAQRSLLVITFDEGDSADNIVACVFAGPAAKRGFVSAKPYTHYSLLKTVENGLGLPALTHEDAAAAPMSDLLR